MSCTIYRYDDIILLVECTDLIRSDKIEEILDAAEAAMSTMPYPVHVLLDGRLARGNP